MMYKTNMEKGISIYLAMMIMTVLLGTALGVSALVIGRLSSLSGLGNSVMALYATDTGIEQVLFADIVNCLGEVDPVVREACVRDNAVLQDTLANGAMYTIEITSAASCGASAYCVKSTGEYNGSRRAIRIAR